MAAGSCCPHQLMLLQLLGSLLWQLSASSPAWGHLPPVVPLHAGSKLQHCCNVMSVPYGFCCAVLCCVLRCMTVSLRLLLSHLQSLIDHGDGALPLITTLLCICRLGAWRGFGG